GARPRRVRTTRAACRAAWPPAAAPPRPAATPPCRPASWPSSTPLGVFARPSASVAARERLTLCAAAPPRQPSPRPGRLRISPGRGGQGVTISSMRQRGFGFIEIIIVVAIVAVAGFLLMQYFSSTAKTVEKLQQDRPLARTRLVADQATLASVQGLVRNYQAEKGQWPPDKGAVPVLLGSAPKVQFRGSDFNQQPAS